jgi:hypothetical protein
MRYSNYFSKLALGASAACLLGAGVPTLAANSPATVAGTWELHKAQFDFYGITTRYSCDSIEDKVKEILVHFGARRKDAHVYASGCPNGQTSPSRTAFVRAEFYVLAPIDDASAPGAVNAQWTALEMRPSHPFFIGDGDCELVKEMQDLLSKNFPLRDVSYTTGCVPHDLTLNGFSVKAQVLKAVPPPKVSALAH